MDDDSIASVFELLGLHTLEQIAAKVGEGSAALAELRELFALAGQLGFGDYLAFDRSVC